MKKRKGARTSGREAALQILYALEDHGEDADIDRLIYDFWRETPGDPEGREYADALVRHVHANLAAIDERIQAASSHWRIAGMARVDRNVLRLCVSELETGEVPRAVAIDEAVELAKRYGAETSGTFVNGVLDKAADLVSEDASTS